MAKAKFCLIVDTEADFFYKIHSPHIGKIGRLKWSLNKLAGRIWRYPKGRNGLINLVRCLKYYGFPTTFNIVGHLYLKECKGFPHFSELKPKARWFNKDWYYWDSKSSFKRCPGLYMGDFIGKEMKVKYFTLGLHSFSHEALTLEDESTVKSIIRAGVKAAKKIGVKPTSFSAPFNMIEDVRDPEKIFKSLKKNGIKIASYTGKDDGFKILRGYDVKPVFKKHGVECIHISNYFEGTSSKNHIKKIVRQIRQSVGKNVVYCLATHDFTWKKVTNLKIIIREVSKLEQDGLIEIKKFGDYVK